VKIIDTHCDQLYKLQLEKKTSGNLLNARNAPQLQTNINRLITGSLKVQFFAIFLETDTPSNKMWQDTLEQIELFNSEVIEKNPEVKHITTWNQLHKLKQNEIGAILTLEGAESFGNDIERLKKLYELGIMSIGLTWNYANLCADGVGEPRGAGLSLLGKEVVKLNNEQNVLTDVSHLSENGFWDVMKLADYPFASHSNAKKVCDHPRNLNDEQIKALIAKKSQIQLVLFPEFVKEANQVTVNDLIKHIDHICGLGGVNNIGFGSDFDGIDQTIEKIDDAAAYPYLINELLNYYSEEEVAGFAYKNFEEFLKKMNLN